MATCWIDFHNPKGTVLVAGVGRSGTTWLAEVLNANNDFRLLFEPFFPDRVDRFGPWWNHHQYVRPGVKTGRHVEAIRCVMEGRIRDPWVDRFNRRWVAWRRLIKEIRANLFLKWIRVAYPTMPIVFLLRHPCACAVSQAKQGWPQRFDRFMEQPDLLHDHLGPFRDLFGDRPTLFETRIVMWCCLNYVPLRQMRSGEMEIVFYEDLCRRPETLLPSLCERIGVRYGSRMRRKLGQASALAAPDSPVVHNQDPVESWRHQVAHDEVKRAMAILERFGLDRIYGEESEPRIPASECLRLFSGGEEADESLG